MSRASSNRAASRTTSDTKSVVWSKIITVHSDSHSGIRFLFNLDASRVKSVRGPIFDNQQMTTEMKAARPVRPKEVLCARHTGRQDCRRTYLPQNVYVSLRANFCAAVNLALCFDNGNNTIEEKNLCPSK